RDAVHRAKYVADWHTPLLLQAALARFIDEGGFARHLRRVRDVYSERHALLVQCLSEEFGDRMEVWPSTNGLHLAAVARDAGPDEVARWADRATAAGVGVQRLGMFRIQREPPPGFALAYGAIASRDIQEGVTLLRECRRGPGRARRHET
ncbi:MAG TPA: hypothetical protein VF147_02680, partial [Vicinamibacterales bacterium]